MTKLDQLGENWRDLWTKLRLFFNWRKWMMYWHWMAISFMMFTPISCFLQNIELSFRKIRSKDVGRLYIYIYNIYIYS